MADNINKQSPSKSQTDINNTIESKTFIDEI